MTDLLHSPLHDRHVALAAKLGDFGGWEMPIQYAGVLQEHAAVRTAVGLFDVSHLGKGVVRGSSRSGTALDFVNDRLTNDLRRIGPGQAQYTLCCDDPTGGVVDDLIAYVRSEQEVFLVPNAANSSQVVSRLAADAPAGIEVADLHTRLAVLAVQGPQAARVVGQLGLPTAHDYMSFTSASWNGHPVVVCRTGYTGELGFELLPHWDDAGELWDAILALDVMPCGLGARDTLRTEMGYPLHGQDLSLDITPVQARVGWAVGWGKDRFWGRDALLAERAAGPRRLLWGLEALDRGIPRPHMAVLRDGAGVGADVGEVTSGTFSPTRKVGIALALLDASVTEGEQLAVDVRGRSMPVRVVKPPFVSSHVR